MISEFFLNFKITLNFININIDNRHTLTLGFIQIIILIEK